MRQGVLVSRKCGRCVLDMDHHCFFLDNCVGRNTSKPFLLFLGWSVIGSLYVVGGTLTLLMMRREQTMNYFSSQNTGRSIFFWAGQMHYTVLLAPGWVQACAFMLTTATAGALGAGSMLKSQSALLLAGRTYISILQDPPANPLSKASFTQIFRLFAGLASPNWAWPAWHSELYCATKRRL